jgi:hypothetical protein
MTKENGSTITILFTIATIITTINWLINNNMLYGKQES